MYFISSFSKVISNNFLNHCEVLSLKIYITFITELEHEHRTLGSKYSSHFVVVQLLSCDQLCPTLCYSMDCSMPGFPVLHHLPEFAQTYVHPVGDSLLWILILCCPLLLPSLFPSIRVFSSESALLIRWPKYWSFSFSISPSKEYSRLISLTIDWLDLLAVQGTLKSLLQHHNSKAIIFQCSAFFIVQLSHPYTTTGKSIALTLGIFVDKVISLEFCFL